ncbi:MAG: hypothetical protein KC912_18985 [Proteobacteria bacterium]|nr:hypothetical protein [Pseudomonadota bacterium]
MISLASLTGCLINRPLHDSASDRVAGLQDSNDSADTDDCTTADENRISDGSFEAFGSEDFSEWAPAHATLTVTGESSHCDYAVEISTLDGGGANHPLGGTLRPGDTLRLTADVRHIGNENVRPGWIVYLHDTAGDSNLTGQTTGYTGSTDWHSVSGELVLPDRPVETFKSGTVTIFGNTEGATSFALDNVVITIDK